MEEIRKEATFFKGKSLRTQYREEFGIGLIEHMASGKSQASYAAILGVTFGTMATWKEKHKEFRECCEIGKMAELSHWEDIAHDLANGNIPKGSASALIFTLKNRFPDLYKDKQEVEHSGGVVLAVNTGIKRPGDDGYIEVEETAPAIEAEFNEVDDGELL